MSPHPACHVHGLLCLGLTPTCVGPAPKAATAPPVEAPPSPLALAAHATIRATLAATRGNIRRAAQALGLSPSALHRRLARDPSLAALAATFTRSERQPARQR